MTPSELRIWRATHNLTQTDLAALLGVDVMTISRWERDERLIPAFLDLALKQLESELICS